MAPTSRRVVPKDRFGALFAALKTQTYHEPASRGPAKPESVILVQLFLLVPFD